jgi:DNA-binding transcriptional MerR regulator
MPHTTKGQATAPRFLTTKQAAQLLDIDKSTLCRWVAQGRVAPKQQAPCCGTQLFDRRQIERLATDLQQQRQAVA